MQSLWHRPRGSHVVAVAVLAIGLGTCPPSWGAAGRLGLSVRVSHRVDARRETSLWVTVDGALPRGARRRGLAVPPAAPAPAPPGAPPLESEPNPAATASSSPTGTIAPPPAPPPASASAVTAPPRLSRELVRATVDAARRAAAAGRGRARIEAAVRRTRRAAALPDVQARAGRTTDESLELRPTVDDPYRYTESGGTKLVGDLRLRWELDRLVFDPAEVRLLSLEQARARWEAELVQRVLRLLFAWHRGRVRAADDALDPEARIDAELDAMEAALTLDVLTGGWFGARTARVDGPSS